MSAALAQRGKFAYIYAFMLYLAHIMSSLDAFSKVLGFLWENGVQDAWATPMRRYMRKKCMFYGIKRSFRSLFEKESP